MELVMSNDLKTVSTIAESIPSEAWSELVGCATELMRKLCSPITSTTEGIGKLIEARFEKYTQAEKVLAGDTIHRACEIAKKYHRESSSKPNPKIIVEILENTRVETDQELRNIWANILASELTIGSVHPEIPNTLKRMSNADAKAFDILCNEKSISSIYDSSWWFLSREILLKLGLVKSIENEAKRDEKFEVTHLGEAFRHAVSGYEANPLAETIWKYKYTDTTILRPQFLIMFAELEAREASFDTCKELLSVFDIVSQQTRYFIELRNKNTDKCDRVKNVQQMNEFILNILENLEHEEMIQ